MRSDCLTPERLFSAPPLTGSAPQNLKFTPDGNALTYDVNTHTNSNPDAEARDGRQGMRSIAEYLTGLLQADSATLAAAA